VSNGTRLLMADGRSQWSRRYRDLVAGHVNDLGGVEELSQAEMAIIRRAATLQVELEASEARLASGMTVNIVEFAMVSNQMRRLLESVGLKRIARDVTPRLSDIVQIYEEREAKQREAAE
jgi:hypothetical protein